MNALTPTTPDRPMALVTGASGGIGRALAECCARAGHGVVLVARSADKLRALADELAQRYGVPTHVCVADLTAPDAIDRIAGAVQAAGQRLDLLVNNAGVGDYGLFADVEADKLAHTLQLDVVALTLLTHRMLPLLRATRGKVLNVASTAAFQPTPYLAVYGGAKAYVRSFSLALAEELRPAGVTVTTLCPGPTQTGFFDHARMHRSALVKNKRLPTPQEVAELGFRAAQRGDLIVVHGWLNRLMAFGSRFAPNRLLMWIARRLAAPQQ
ncbi:MAG: SDR family oxidoreductase [Pseudomonadota bacterium]|nr:SDR family oxidoreductase [Pseudomonadota bacterium]